MDVTVGALAAQLNAEVIGNADLRITELGPLKNAGANTLSFFADDMPMRLLDKSTAGAVLLSETRLGELTETHRESKTVIVTEDAMASFMVLLESSQTVRPRPEIGVSARAIVSDSALIGEGSNIHPGAVIGEGVVIGAGCDIHSGVVIGDDCELGESVTIYPNAVLYANCEIHDRVIVHANAVIGADGFGYRFADGKFNKLPHFGSVILEADVEIGANATVDRGMIGPTVIREGTKIDNLVMIAHNCEIGRHNAFASQVGIAGSSSTGDYVRCGGQVGIADHVHIGNGASLGASTGVHRDLAAGQTYLGAPARPAEQTYRILMAQTKLPEMRTKLRELAKHVAQLEARVNESTQPETQENVNDAA